VKKKTKRTVLTEEEKMQSLETLPRHGILSSIYAGLGHKYLPEIWPVSGLQFFQQPLRKQAWEIST
jgi:hypothetical protein